MEPIKVKQTNCVYTAPGCGDLPVVREVDEEGHLSVTSAWKPSAEDLEVLNAGGCICLTVLGGQPPVSMWAQEVNIAD